MDHMWKQEAATEHLRIAYEIWNQGGDVAHIVDDRQAIYISLIYITKEKRDNIKRVIQWYVVDAYTLRKLCDY